MSTKHIMSRLGVLQRVKTHPTGKHEKRVLLPLIQQALPPRRAVPLAPPRRLSSPAPHRFLDRVPRVLRLASVSEGFVRRFVEVSQPRHHDGVCGYGGEPNVTTPQQFDAPASTPRQAGRQQARAGWRAHGARLRSTGAGSTAVAGLRPAPCPHRHGRALLPSASATRRVGGWLEDDLRGSAAGEETRMTPRTREGQKTRHCGAGTRDSCGGWFPPYESRPGVRGSRPTHNGHA